METPSVEQISNPMHDASSHDASSHVDTSQYNHNEPTTGPTKMEKTPGTYRIFGKNVPKVFFVGLVVFVLLVIAYLLIVNPEQTAIAEEAARKKRKGQEAGVSRWLLKPVTTQVLFRILDSIEAKL